MIEVDGQYLGLDTITIMYDYLSMNNNGPFVVITIIIDTWSRFCGVMLLLKKMNCLLGFCALMDDDNTKNYFEMNKLNYI